MDMITIDQISTPQTSILMINGNGGEELLVLMFCGNIIINTVSAGDGSPKTLYKGPINKAKLQQILRTWATTGIPPTAKEGKVIERRIQTVLRRAESICII